MRTITLDRRKTSGPPVALCDGSPLAVALDLHARTWPDSHDADLHRDRLRLEAEAAGDPLVERYGRQRKESQASRVLSILDELERGGA